MFHAFGSMVLAAAVTMSPVYHGTGWDALSYSQTIAPGKFVFTFKDTNSYNKTNAWVREVAKQLNTQLGWSKFSVSSTIRESVPFTQCAPRGHIVIQVVKDPKPGYNGTSLGGPCVSNGRVVSGRTMLDSDYWVYGGPVYAKAITRKEINTHEIGHTLGLGHPETKCDKTKKTFTPGMCQTPNRSVSTTGLFRSYDLTGLKQLVKNDEILHNSTPLW